MPDQIELAALFALGFFTLLVAGVFQAFSDFVMAGLKRACPSAGAEVMQHINRTVIRSVFVVSLLAIAPLSAALAFYAAFNMDGSSRALTISAAVIYIPAVFLVTAAANVPRNERLDKMAAYSNEGRDYWAVYLREWTGWNHVRTLGSAATGAVYMLAAITL